MEMIELQRAMIAGTVVGTIPRSILNILPRAYRLRRRPLDQRDVVH